jgi:hypothetical protein
VADDAHLAAVLVARPGQAVTARAGDLRRTLGFVEAGHGAPVRAYDIDLIAVELDDGEVHHAVAHVVAGGPWWRGGWWRGPVVVAMNVEFHGRWDVAPRGHPNDGRCEVFEVGESFGVRRRIQAWRRLSSGTHVPHPDIRQRSVERKDIELRRRLRVFVDGQAVGRTRRIALRVLPDAGVVHF